MIRVVRDGYSILFIQDILVLPEFQRQGIGSTLLKKKSLILSQMFIKFIY
ncbi:GNAT family N-acetyltransferase [Globicatella sanguinis]